MQFSWALKLLAMLVQPPRVMAASFCGWSSPSSVFVVDCLSALLPVYARQAVSFFPEVSEIQVVLPVWSLIPVGSPGLACSTARFVGCSIQGSPMFPNDSTTS